MFCIYVHICPRIVSAFVATELPLFFSQAAAHSSPTTTMGSVSTLFQHQPLSVLRHLRPFAVALLGDYSNAGSSGTPPPRENFDQISVLFIVSFSLLGTFKKQQQQQRALIHYFNLIKQN